MSIAVLMIIKEKGRTVAVGSAVDKIRKLESKVKFIGVCCLMYVVCDITAHVMSTNNLHDLWF